MTYSRSLKVLHWVMLVFISFMFISAIIMKDYASPETRGLWFLLHKSTGVAVMTLIIIRILARWKSAIPALPAKLKIWEKRLAHTVQYAMYALIIFMPTSGILMSQFAGRNIPFYGAFEIVPFVTANRAIAHFFNEWHESVAWILLGLIGLHVAGFLKHWLIDKENLLKRMG